MINKSPGLDHSLASLRIEAAVLEAARYVVGDANASSGYYRCDFADDAALGDTTRWRHAGWRNVRAFGLARTGGALFIAGGNGVLRSRDDGATWRVTTDWRITEVLALATDPYAPAHLWATTAHGLWMTPDLGDTWLPIRTDGVAPDERFGHAVAVDVATPGRVVLGTEAGVRVSPDAGVTWSAVGPSAAIRALAQSQQDAALWLAATDGAGVLRSVDGGATWFAPPVLDSAAALYAVTWDPLRAGHAAAIGFHTGLLTTDDEGATWAQHTLESSADAWHALAFDPLVPGRLWLGSIGEGVWVQDAPGEALRAVGPPETTIYALMVTV